MREESWFEFARLPRSVFGRERLRWRAEERLFQGLEELVERGCLHSMSHELRKMAHRMDWRGDLQLVLVVVLEGELVAQEVRPLMEEVDGGFCR